MTLIRYMENHFQEEFASLEDKTGARAQVIHVFQCGGFVAMSLQAVSLRQPREIEALLVVRTTQKFSKWTGIQPGVSRNQAGSGAKHDWNRVRSRTSNAIRL